MSPSRVDPNSASQRDQASAGEDSPSTLTRPTSSYPASVPEPEQVPLVWIDFNDMLARDWCAIRTDERSDLSRQGFGAKEGLRLRGYDNDEEPSGTRNSVITEGTLAKYPGGGALHGIWAVKLDYLAHESEFADEPGHWCHQVDWAKEEEGRRRWLAKARGS